jgi:hypothetical protein
MPIMKVLPAEAPRRRAGFFLALGLLALAVPVRAATPREELLRLVPDSVGFCVIVQDLRGHAASLDASPFVEQLRQSPLIAKLRTSEELKKLDRFEAKMKDKLGLDWAQLRDNVLGDALAFAYRPGPPGKPEQEQGLILLRARNAKILADLIERLNKVQKEEGELMELEECRHNGATYYRRSERGKPPTFYYAHGPVLALSSQEEMLRQAIDCDRKRDADAVPAVTRRLRELDAERALFAVWLNPRAFDAEVESKAAGTPAERVPIVKNFAIYWKALESVVLSLTPADREVNLSLGVRARVEELPPAARRLFHAASTPSELWRRFPEQTLVAAGSRLDGAALLDMLGGFLTPQGRQSLDDDLNRQVGALLGGDLHKEVLPALGPDWGLYVTAPEAKGKGWMPQSLFALRVAPTKGMAPLERTLLRTLDVFAGLIIFGHNHQHPDRPMTLKTLEADKREIHYLASERGLPAGVQPAFALINGYLVLSSSLDGIRRFVQTTPAPAPAADAPMPLVRVSIKDWRAYLKDHREPIVQFLADKHQLSRDDAGRQLENLLTSLQFVDRVELRQRTASGQVLFTLSVQTAPRGAWERGKCRVKGRVFILHSAFRTRHWRKWPLAPRARAQYRQSHVILVLSFSGQGR